MSTLRHLCLKRETCNWKPRTCLTFKQCRFRIFGFVLFFSSQYFTNCYLFYYTGMPRKNWMISDLILPPEKVSRMFPSIKSDCLKYLQQCLIRINSYSQSSLSKKKKRTRPLWFNFNLYGKPAWRNINVIVGTFANKLELIAEEQCNAWNSFLLCSTAFNVVPKLWVACDSLQLK